MLESILVILPPSVVQKVIHFVAMILGPQGEEVPNKEWTERCDLLRSLCLVSKLCRSYALPFLYGKLRLHLRLGRNPLSILVDTLTQSKNREPPLGYGAFTRTLILVTPSGKDLPPLEVSPLELRDLLHMMPGLRTVAMSGEGKPPGYRLVSKPMTTLEIHGLGAFPLLSKEFTLQVLTYVQELSISWREPFASADNWAPNKPLASPLLFPNLCSISMDYFHEDTIGDACTILDQLRSWTMPCLTIFQIHIDSGDLPDADHRDFCEPLARFLEEHGNSIQYLTLMGRRGGISPDICELSRVCPNLRFLKVSFDDDGWLVDDPPIHPTLETLVVYEYYRKTLKEHEQYHEEIQKFENGIPNTFPNLRNAKITWEYLYKPRFYSSQVRRFWAMIQVDGGSTNYDEDDRAVVEGDDWK